MPPPPHFLDILCGVSVRKTLTYVYEAAVVAVQQEIARCHARPGWIYIVDFPFQHRQRRVRHLRQQAAAATRNKVRSET